MTMQEFIVQLEGYYGEYRPAVKPVVIQWIRSQSPSGRELGRLFAELVKTQTGQYRTPPDVAIMRPLLSQIKAESEHEYLADVTRVALPDVSEVVDRETQNEFWGAVIDAMKAGRDPADDQRVTGILDRLGVLHQVSE